MSWCWPMAGYWMGDPASFVLLETGPSARSIASLHKTVNTTKWHGRHSTNEGPASGERPPPGPDSTAHSFRRPNSA